VVNELVVQGNVPVCLLQGLQRLFLSEFLVLVVSVYVSLGRAGLLFPVFCHCRDRRAAIKSQILILLRRVCKTPAVFCRSSEKEQAARPDFFVRRIDQLP